MGVASAKSRVESKVLQPQATNSIWRRETRTMATPMRSLSVGVAKSVREWFLDRRWRGFDWVHRRRSIAKQPLGTRSNCCRSRKSIHSNVKFTSCLHPLFSTGSISGTLHFYDSNQRPTERTTL